MRELRCTQCSGTDLKAGFVEETGPLSAGHVRWIAGKMQKTIFGIAWRLAKPRWRIDAHRCEACGHLELFASTLDRVGVPE